MIIPGIERMEGPDPTMAALARAVRAAVDPAVTDEYMFGISGVAFLATVCANNCNCRDYRELSLRIEPGLRRIAVTSQYWKEGGPEAWEDIRKSIDDGVPVVVFNLFGDYEDALLTGYDLDKDLAYGWGAAPAGKEYATAKLSEWKGQPIYAYVVRRARRAALDLKAIELEALSGALALAARPAIEGG